MAPVRNNNDVVHISSCLFNFPEGEGSYTLLFLAFFICCQKFETLLLGEEIPKGVGRDDVPDEG